MGECLVRRRYVAGLPERVLSVLAAKTIGYQGAEDIALVALREPYERIGRPDKPTKKQVNFTKRTLASKDPLIQRCLILGLPRGVYGNLARPVRCSCGSLITVAPCVQCSSQLWEETVARIGDRPARPYETPAESTVAEPGTPEKIAVIKARIRAGESAFHPCDPVYIPPKANSARIRLISTEFIPVTLLDRFRRNLGQYGF